MARLLKQIGSSSLASCSAELSSLVRRLAVQRPAAVLCVRGVHNDDDQSFVGLFNIRACQDALFAQVDLCMLELIC